MSHMYIINNIPQGYEQKMQHPQLVTCCQRSGAVSRWSRSVVFLVRCLAIASVDGEALLVLVINRHVVLYKKIIGVP